MQPFHYSSLDDRVTIDPTYPRKDRDENVASTDLEYVPTDNAISDYWPANSDTSQQFSVDDQYRASFVPGYSFTDISDYFNPTIDPFVDDYAGNFPLDDGLQSPFSWSPDSVVGESHQTMVSPQLSTSYPLSPTSISSPSTLSSMTYGATESDTSSPSSLLGVYNDFDLPSSQVRGEAFGHNMGCGTDPRGLSETFSMSPPVRRLALESSMLLSESGDRERKFAVPEAESAFQEGAQEPIVTSPLSTSTSFDVDEVGVEEIDLDGEEGAWDGFRKEGSKWVCEQCGKGVTGRKSDLKRHLAIHRGKGFFCTKDCGKSFTRRDAMRRHTSNCGKNLKRGPKPGSKRIPKPKSASTSRPRRPRSH